MPNKELKQPLFNINNPSECLANLRAILYQGNLYMATYHDPVQRFAPLEVIERFLEIRAELGYSQAVYMPSSKELVGFLDAFGFDVYAFTTEDQEINFGDYRSPIVPGGDNAHTSLTGH